MPPHPSFLLLRHLRQLAVTSDDTVSDRELLHRFAERRDEGAFASLMRRHGPMVLRVCRRVLPHGADAEDAFQATFLTLARKAGAVRWHDSASGWLYGVARNTALRARDAAARRERRERQAPTRASADPLAEMTARELLGALDEELSRRSWPSRPCAGLWKGNLSRSSCGVGSRDWCSAWRCRLPRGSGCASSGRLRSWSTSALRECQPFGGCPPARRGHG